MNFVHFVNFLSHVFVAPEFNMTKSKLVPVLLIGTKTNQKVIKTQVWVSLLEIKLKHKSNNYFNY